MNKNDWSAVAKKLAESNDRMASVLHRVKGLMSDHAIHFEQVEEELSHLREECDKGLSFQEKIGDLFRAAEEGVATTQWRREPAAEEVESE